MRKGRIFGVVLLILLLALVACDKAETYTPYFTLAEDFTLSGDTISGRIYGDGLVAISDIVTTPDRLIVFADSTGEAYTTGYIPLVAGENELILRFGNGTREREYHLHIELVVIRSIEIEVVRERTYHVGEKFDTSTIVVRAETADGETVIIDHYTVEYEFSSLGKSTVGIELGGFYKTFSVTVDSEYLPTLDGDMSADGVIYAVSNGTATLISAKDMSGFFAVPSAVVIADEQIPLTAIGEGAFEGSALAGVRIPDEVLSVGERAFADCASLEWADLPSYMETLGRYAFSGCVSLATVMLPDGLVEIPTGAFRDCASLFAVSMPDSIEVIGDRAFSGCTKLLSFRFPTALSRVGTEAFAGCAALSRAVIGHLDSLGDRAFADCTSLSVFACAEIMEIGARVFDGAPVTLYTAEGSRFAAWAMAQKIGVTAVSKEPCIVSLPNTFAIEDGYPLADVCALYLADGIMRQMTDYAVKYPQDACGNLTATLVWHDFMLSFPIFVSYTEPVALDTDSRGALYELDSTTMTAVRVSAPEWVRRSSVYIPQTDGLFIVPTEIVRADGVYRVIGVRDGAFDECQNVSSLFMPQ